MNIVLAFMALLFLLNIGGLIFMDWLAFVGIGALAAIYAGFVRFIVEFGRRKGWEIGR